MRKPGTLRKNTVWKNTVWKNSVWKNSVWKIQFGKIQFGKYSLENTVWNEGMSCRLINPIKCLKKHKSLGFLLEGIL